MAEGIAILPRLEGLGGPASFRARFCAGLEKRGIPVCDRIPKEGCAAVLVIAGTRRHLGELIAARRRGLRVVQRLDGMNWVHRRRRTGWKHALRSEYGNRLLALTRRWLADRVVYQSQFALNWWQTVYGPVPAPGRVIYNGVDLQAFRPDGPEERPNDRVRLLLVEGHFGGGNEQGLENAIQLARGLDTCLDRPVELVVAGQVPEPLRQAARAWAGDLMLTWAGVLPREQIPAADRSAHLLFSADINAACPNAVIEAMACGLPVTGFATGSLPELVQGDAGRLAPYGSNYWALEPPVMGPLVEAAREVLAGGEEFRSAARRRAEQAFDLERVIDQYVEVLLG
ncbi:MAG TPA: glycosyltransferase family 4 protein [Anaerolineaceae bacterium]|nr:glycosyltransferase family 4 protein [Anaerolineaceae bacterium]